MNRHLERVRLLLLAYLGLSTATVVAVVLLRHDTDVVTSAVWVRTLIVLATAVLDLLFLAQAARGSARGLLRLRIVTAIMLVAIVVIVAAPQIFGPGAFPVWLRVEQAVCGLLMLGVVVTINRRDVLAPSAP